MKKAFIYHDHKLKPAPAKDDIVFVYWGINDTSIMEADKAFNKIMKQDIIKMFWVGCEIVKYENY